MWLVWCQTNYGDGYYFGGLYRSYEKAEKRWEWCQKYTFDDDNDAWYLDYVETRGITAPFYDSQGEDFRRDHPVEEDENA